MALEFAWPWLFLALPLPLLSAWLLPPATAPAAARLRFPFPGALAPGGVAGSGVGSRARLGLALLAWLLLVSAAARPQWVGETLTLPVSGRSLMLAVDISASMQTADMVLDGSPVIRLVAVKRFAGDFIARRQGDRLGLILFGEQAYLQTPLTFDRATVRALLLEAAIGLAGKNTAVGDAIGLAVKRLREEPEANRVLVLLTDGANTAGTVQPLKAADLAALEAVRIYTIGVGDDRATAGSPFGPLQRPTSDLDEATLKAIAARTGGRYFRARSAEGLEQIYALIDEIEPLSADERRFRRVDELYAWPLGGALLLSLLLASRVVAGPLQHLRPWAVVERWRRG